MMTIFIFCCFACSNSLRIISSNTDYSRDLWPGLNPISLSSTTFETLNKEFSGHDSLDAAFKVLNSTIDGSCRGPLSINDVPGFWALPIPSMLGPHQLPRYECTPKHAGDIVKALAFANAFGIKVNTKVHGHSTMGASAAALPEGGNSTLLILMEDMDSIEILNTGFMDTCGKYTTHAVKAGGGTMFGQLYQVMAKMNYSFVGGTCNSVGFAGGWSLLGGMSQQQHRKLGLGTDNVLQFEILLGTGIILTVDHCTHPALFKALRGGGGGFGIILSVVYPLWEGSEVQLYSFAFSNKTVPAVNYTKWWETIVLHTPTMDDRFTFDPAAFQAGNWGFPSPDQMWTMPGQATLRLFFLGSAAEAEQHSVFQDFKKLIDKVPAPYRNFSHFSWDTLGKFKRERAWQTAKSDGEWNVGASMPIGGYALPMKHLIENPVDAAHVLEELSNDIPKCKNTFWYQYGGKVAANKWMSSEQVVTSRVRDWAYFILFCSRHLLEKLATKFPLQAGGGWSPNHYILGQAEVTGQDYIIGQWGEDHFKYLLWIKQLYDPGNLFGCRECVGWSPRLANYKSFITNPMYFESLKKTKDPYLESWIASLKST